jgi:hypothetical protein
VSVEISSPPHISRVPLGMFVDDRAEAGDTVDVLVRFVPGMLVVVGTVPPLAPEAIAVMTARVMTTPKKVSVLSAMACPDQKRCCSDYCDQWNARADLVSSTRG